MDRREWINKIHKLALAPIGTIFEYYANERTYTCVITEIIDGIKVCYRINKSHPHNSFNTMEIHFNIPTAGSDVTYVSTRIKFLHIINQHSVKNLLAMAREGM